MLKVVFSDVLNFFFFLNDVSEPAIHLLSELKKFFYWIVPLGAQKSTIFVKERKYKEKDLAQCGLNLGQTQIENAPRF